MGRLPLWHLTENPNWVLDPTYHPIWGYTIPTPTFEPGLFVTDYPSYWKSWMGIGPIYAVRIEVPDGALPQSWVTYQHPEYLIKELNKVEITEILPLEEAIRRGQAEERAGIPLDRQEYGGFASVEDWWYHCHEVWDDNKMQQVTRCRTRKGLSSLMEEWRAQTGYKNPHEKYEKQEREAHRRKQR
jgi:hypothetical protein